ncbi:MAG TPA: aminotransferase class I/II-fold pyridoxal phosphate-dependent enzyme [Longimicrobiales bacterium]
MAKHGARVSAMAEEMVGSAILKVAGEIRELVAAGKEVCNLTVGDFAPSQFPVPELLASATAQALQRGETNYPPSAGLPALRSAVAQFYRERLGLDYSAEQILITAGARPSIYAAFRVLLDAGDRVVCSVPAWNVPYYSYLVGAQLTPVECTASTAFLPTRAMLEPHVRGARLVTLNSPLNPAGTAFSATTLRAICELVVEENERRGADERPLYLLYDQIYWLLTFHGLSHVNPVSLCPAVAPYTVLIDGMSKHFAATGMRVGWAAAPADILRSMSDFNGHVGAWAPRAEQIASIALLQAPREIEAFHHTMVPKLQARLDALYDGLCAMKQAGLPVDAVPAMGGIYLSARFDLAGQRTPGGTRLQTNEDVRSYLLHSAGFAVVAFQAFGVSHETGWFRLSVGAVSMEQIEAVLPRLERALQALS